MKINGWRGSVLDFRKIKIGDIAAPDQVVDRARFSRAGRSISGGAGCANERTRPCGGRPTAGRFPGSDWFRPPPIGFEVQERLSAQTLPPEIERRDRDR